MSLVFSWRARQMLRRRTSNAERAPPPFLNSLAALQVWQNCPQMRHPGAQERRCSVSAQRWSAGVTPPPLIARTNRKRLLLSPNKCSRIDASPCFACPTRRNKIALERCSSNAKNPIVFTPRFAHRAHINRTSHVLIYLHITARKQLFSQFVFVFRILTPVSSVVALATF